MTVKDRQDLLEELLTSPPVLHGTDDDPRQWMLLQDALRWLADHVEEGDRTLETGCGVSSLVFAVKGARHTIVAPWHVEHERVRNWCERRGVSTENLTSVIAQSQDALPGLEPHELSLGLIDGSHALPMPFLDWYYLAVRLRVGGYVLVDDVHLRPCRLLRDFLIAERGRWELVETLTQAVAFRKLSDPVIEMNDWESQPWNFQSPESAPTAGAALRAALRPRTRLRNALSRLTPGSS